MLYACTESVKQDGQVFSLQLNGKNGALAEHCPPVSAGVRGLRELARSPFYDDAPEDEDEARRRVLDEGPRARRS